MKRAFGVLLLSGALSGCAVLSSSSSSTTTTSTAYQPMASMPPPAQREDPPRLADKEVWVPGYYQPVAGTWLWHDGQVMPDKQGYTLVPASYKEENGHVFFSPPHWRRSDLRATK